MMATKKLSPTFSVPTRKFYNIGFLTPIEGSAGTDNTLSFHQLSFKKNIVRNYETLNYMMWFLNQNEKIILINMIATSFLGNANC